jgi:hypothetical protein
MWSHMHVFTALFGTILRLPMFAMYVSFNRGKWIAILIHCGLIYIAHF